MTEPPRKHLVTRSLALRPILMLRNPKERIEEKLPQSGNFPPMPLACTICTGRSGSGVQIDGMRITRVRLQMAVLGAKVVMRIILRCGAVPGAAFPFTAALRTAASAIGATTSAASMVFVWCAAAGELNNPFFSSSITLYPFLFFSLFCHRQVTRIIELKS